VPVPSEAVRAKIHATFRIGYLRDAVLPRSLDDATFTALHSMMMFNYMEVLQSLQAAPAYFATLFARLREVDWDSDDAATLMHFLQVRALFVRLCRPDGTQDTHRQKE
jgi:protein phosphatase 4 regulatory subunit 3